MDNIQVRESLNHINKKKEGVKVKEEIKKIEEQSIKEINEASNLKELNDLRVKYLGKKGEITAVLRGMGSLSAEERPKIGSIVNVVKDKLETEIKNKEEIFQNGKRSIRVYKTPD